MRNKGFMQITLVFNNSVNKGLQSVLYVPTLVFVCVSMGIRRIQSLKEPIVSFEIQPISDNFRPP